MSSLGMWVIGEKRRESRESVGEGQDWLLVVLWFWFPSRGKCARREVRKGSQGPRKILGRVWHPQSQEENTCQEGSSGQLPPVMLSEPLASWHLGKWKKKQKKPTVSQQKWTRDMSGQQAGTVDPNCRFGKKCEARAMGTCNVSQGACQPVLDFTLIFIADYNILTRRK